MKFLSTVTTSIILLSPFSASAYDANEQFQDCVKNITVSYHDDLAKECATYPYCRGEKKRDEFNLFSVVTADGAFDKIQLSYDASTIIIWANDVGLNESNTDVILRSSVDKCGITF